MKTWLVTAQVRTLFNDGQHWQWYVPARDGLAAVDRIRECGYFCGPAMKVFDFYYRPAPLSKPRQEP